MTEETKESEATEPADEPVVVENDPDSLRVVYKLVRANADEAARRWARSTALHKQPAKLTKRQKLAKWWHGLFLVQLWKASKRRALGAVNRKDPLAFSFETELTEGERLEQLRLAKRSQILQLRRTVAKWAIFFVVLQLACSNYFFWRYLDGRDFSIHPEVMIAWLSACVIEVIGILVVITRSLFPQKDRSKDKDNGDSKKNA
ncbi:hypothetical protein ACFSYH_02100 [Populibacterium corticicola]|uniref:Uncharacterized protein n=1 Tax=Populibacterium corticicola TaxID=1812826 RepID=A0ABW5XE38_9MICO